MFRRPSFRFLLPATALTVGLLLSGCSPGIKMVGTWEVDSEKLQADVAKEGGGNPLAALAAGMLSVIEAQVEFKADGSFTGTASALGQQRTAKGTWRYAKTDGEDMVLSIKGDNDPAERELRVRFTDWDHIQMVPPIDSGGPIGTGSFPFKRVKKT